MSGGAQVVHRLEEVLGALRRAHLPHLARAIAPPLFQNVCTTPRGTSTLSPAFSTRVSPPSFTLSSPSSTSKCSSCEGCECGSGLCPPGFHSASTSSSSPPVSADGVRTVTFSSSLSSNTSPVWAMR